MKEIIQKFAGRLGMEPRRRHGRFNQVVAWGCALLLSAVAHAQAQSAPLNDNFTNAIVISGVSGSTSGKNSGATLQTSAGESGVILTSDNGPVSVGESVWFQWTAPTSGNVTFDTLGSADVNFNTMDTVLSAWTGASLATLSLVGANDNASVSSVNSSETFLATAGITYYISIAVNTGAAGQPGNYVLNWSEQGAPISGEFRLTSADYTYSTADGSTAYSQSSMGAIPARATVTRVGGASGLVHVAYTISGGNYTNIFITNSYTTNIVVSTVDSNGVAIGAITNFVTTVANGKEAYENYDPLQGYFYTSQKSSSLFILTNIGGAITFSYTNGLDFVTNAPFNNTAVATFTNVVTNATMFSTTVSGIPVFPATSTNVVTNTDLSVTTTTFNYAWTNTVVSNIISSVPGFVFNPPGGILTFEDFQMNKDISIAFSGTPALVPNLANPYVFVTLTTNYLDASEDQTIPAPTIQASRSISKVTLLNYAASPFIYGSFALTNNVVNFERATVRCTKTVNGTLVANIGVKISLVDTTVDRKAYYRINYAGTEDNYNSFTLQAGSDYARPDTATSFTAATDFTNVTGEIDWPAFDINEKYIQIPISQDNLVKFNQDLEVELYVPDGVTFLDMNDVYGNVTECYLTELYTTPTAGACDVGYNADNNNNTSPPLNKNPGANGVVYAAVVQPADGKAVIGGDFTAYNSASGANRNHIARVNTDGQLDSTFNPGTGFDADVNALALDASQDIIAVGQFPFLQWQLA